MEDQQPVLRFSLSDVPEGERRTAVREFFGRSVMNVDFIPQTDDPRMELEARLFPGVAVTYGWNTPFISATAYNPSRENDDFLLVWGSRGGRMCQRGTEVLSDHGAVLLSCAEPTNSETRIDARHVTVRLKRSLLLPMAPDAEQLLMSVVPQNNEALRLLDTYLETVRGELVETPEVAHAVAAHIADLVALAVGSGGGAFDETARRGLRAGRLAAVKRWVLERLQEPDLCVGRAAAAQHVTPRYIQMLFETEGTTFSAFVLGQRLAFARRRLSEPLLARTSIASIAFDSGFGDLSHFNRSFHAAYGERPSDVRHRALQHCPPGGSLADNSRSLYAKTPSPDSD